MLVGEFCQLLDVGKLYTDMEAIFSSICCMVIFWSKINNFQKKLLENYGVSKEDRKHFSNQ